MYSVFVSCLLNLFYIYLTPENNKQILSKMSRNPKSLYKSSLDLLIELVLNDDNLTSLEQVKSNCQYIKQLAISIQLEISMEINQMTKDQDLNPYSCWLKDLLIYTLCFGPFGRGWEARIKFDVSKVSVKFLQCLVELVNVDNLVQLTM